MIDVSDYLHVVEELIEDAIMRLLNCEGSQNNISYKSQGK